MSKSADYYSEIIRYRKANSLKNDVIPQIKESISFVNTMFTVQ